MKPSNKPVAIVTAILCASSMISAANAQGPVPIREASPGLLANAPIPPALARLTAFGEFPGARMVTAEILRESSDLLYSFEFKFDNHRDTEHVLIDAVTGQVIRIEYSVEQGRGENFVINGPPELMALVESSYSAARHAIDKNAEHCKVVKCKLRVERSAEIYVFEVEVGGDNTLQQILIDANTGILLSNLPSP